MGIWFILPGIGLLVIIVLYILNWYKGKQRRKIFKKLAETMNFTFSEKGDESALYLGQFHLFSQGHFHRISNVLTGMFGDIHVMIMDYKYTTSRGRYSSTYQQTVLTMESDRLLLPSFNLQPTTLLYKIGHILGEQDINFDTAPVFSKKYLLRGKDEESIRRLFNERVFEYYEHHPGLNTEGGGNKLIYYRNSKLVSLDEIQAFLQEGYDIFSLFKS
jgi:hypothetical protein